MASERKYLTEQHFGHPWGCGTLREAADVRALAYSAGCPIPNEVIAAKGPEQAAGDYLSANQKFWQMIDVLYISNWRLAVSILAHRNRNLPYEPVGHFEEETVPQSHLGRIAPKCGFGFNLSRLTRLGCRITGEDEGLGEMEGAIAQSSKLTIDQAEFTVLVADRVYQLTKGSDRYSEKLFSYLFSASQLREQNNQRDQRNTARAATKLTPDLWNEYLKIAETKDRPHSINLVSPD